MKILGLMLNFSHTGLDYVKFMVDYAIKEAISLANKKTNPDINKTLAVIEDSIKVGLHMLGMKIPSLLYSTGLTKELTHKEIFFYKVNLKLRDNQNSNIEVNVIAVVKTPNYNIYIKHVSTVYIKLADQVTLAFDTFLSKIVKGYEVSTQAVKATYDEVKRYRERCQMVSRLTDEFFLGIGPEKRVFIDDEVAKSFSDAWLINNYRDIFYKEVNNGRDVINKPLTAFGGKFGLEGLLRAGFDPVEQYVGSYRVPIIRVVNGKFLQFTITNDTSGNSFFYDLGPSWSRSTVTPMGTTTQTYIFTEPIDFNKVRNRKYLKP